MLKEQRDLQKQLRRKRFALQLQSLDHKKTILLDCSQVRWLWNDNRASTDLGNSIEALPKVLRKLKNTDPAKHRLVLAVRPSAGVFADQLRKLLKQEFPALEIAAEPLAAESSAEVLP